MSNPDALKTVPITILLPDLLKQFNKPTLLGARDVILTKIQIDAIAVAIRDDDALPDEVTIIAPAMCDIVNESLAELQERFDLSFEQALRTSDISEVAPWETTAEFLEIANIKSNAELRISAGCSILAFLGDATLAQHLLTVIRVDDGTNDVDAMIARRALATYTNISMDADDFIEQVSTVLKSE